MLKKIAHQIHLWAGLITGLIVFVVSVTGALMVFDKELNALFLPALYKVTPGRTTVGADVLLKRAQQAIGADKRIGNLLVGDADEAYVFAAVKGNKKKDRGIFTLGRQKYNLQVFVNPYTGKVLGVRDMRFSFFRITEDLHRQLLLDKPDGSLIVGICVLVYIVMLFTGFVLWVPRHFKQVRQRLQVKWRARWRRVNYDLHNTLGFFALPLLLLIAVTGLTWSFKWWEAGIYRILGDKNPPVYFREPADALNSVAERGGPGVVLENIKRELKGNYESISLGLPDKNNNVYNAFVVLKNRVDGWSDVSYYFADRRTGEIYSRILHRDKTTGAKWRNSNKDIHTGRIYGWPTQVLFFVACLVSASLPVTGFLIWWGRRHKAKRHSEANREGD